MSNELTVTSLPTPNRIAQSLETMVDMLKGDDFDKRAMVKMLVTQAANVRMLFELQADPDTGEFKLQNYGQAWMLADLLANGDMVPSSYKKPEQVVVGLMKAMEIGVSPISGLANIMIVNNRPSVWGDLAQALVQRSGVWEKHLKEELNGPAPGPDLALDKWPNDYGFRVSIWRKGNPEPFVGEYTVGRAKRAGLWGNTKKLPWITDPMSMLFNRARAFAVREGFADKLFGMGIIEEQMDFDVPPSQLGHQEQKQLVNLADDEPETEPEGPRNYAEMSEPIEGEEEVSETPPQSDAPAAGGSSTAPEPEIASDEAPAKPEGQSEPEGPLL